MALAESTEEDKIEVDSYMQVKKRGERIESCLCNQIGGLIIISHMLLLHFKPLISLVLRVL